MSEHDTVSVSRADLEAVLDIAVHRDADDVRAIARLRAALSEPSEPEPMREHPAFIHHPDHMKGWEAFGVVGPDAVPPTVRRLGIVTFGPRGSTPTTNERQGTEKWGPGEVKLGVASIQFGTFADSTDGGYLYVCGPKQADVERRWHEAASALGGTLGALWPKSRPAATPTGEADK